MRQIFKVTFPNGKIYVGYDETDTLTFFGSPDPKLIALDFPGWDRAPFTMTKEILWASNTATTEDVREKKTEFILALRANDPGTGYNQVPKHRP